MVYDRGVEPVAIRERVVSNGVCRFLATRYASFSWRRDKSTIKPTQILSAFDSGDHLHVNNAATLLKATRFL